jgi:hypothetical protein
VRAHGRRQTGRCLRGSGCACAWERPRVGGDGRRHAWASSADGFWSRPPRLHRTTAQERRVACACADVPGAARRLLSWVLIGGRRKQCGWLEPSAFTRPDLGRRGRWSTARRDMSQARSANRCEGECSEFGKQSTHRTAFVRYTVVKPWK